MLTDLAVRFKEINNWNAGSIHEVITGVAEMHDAKLGKIAQPLRVAVSGVSATPPIDVTVALVGKAKTLQRLERALGYIRDRRHDNA